MSDNKVFVSSKIVEISEYKTYLELVNRVCFYDEPNFNGTMLPHDDTAEEKAQTLKNMPVVAKYTTDVMGKPTFKGHEVSIDKNGEVVFGTTPIGVHTDVWIAEDQVEVTDGTTKTLPCLFAKQRIWSRNKNAVAAIQRLYSENNLHNSWEISVSQYVFENGVKRLTDYAFEGNCLLGTAKPAYGSSAEVLTVATDELLVAEALSQDMLENDSTGNEVHKMDEIINETVETVEEGIAETVEGTPVVEEVAEVEETVEVIAPEPEISELTMRDLRRKIEDALYMTVRKYLDVGFIFPESHTCWAHDWEDKETDMYEFSYTVNEDEVIVFDIQRVTLLVSPRNINSSMDEKNAALVDANAKINELSAQIESLSVYKEAAEKAEREAAEAKRISDVAELRAYTESANIFTKEELASTEIEEMISSLKTTEIKALIADRIVAKSRKTKPEVATVKQLKERVDINTVPDTNLATAFREYIHGKK